MTKREFERRVHEIIADAKEANDALVQEANNFYPVVTLKVAIFYQDSGLGEIEKQIQNLEDRVNAL